MRSLHSELISKASTQPEACARHQAASDRLYRAGGVALAAAISSIFWMGIMAITLPAAGITPSSMALALTGMSIASFVAACLLALRTGNPAIDLQ